MFSMCRIRCSLFTSIAVYFHYFIGKKVFYSFSRICIKFSSKNKILTLFTVSSLHCLKVVSCQWAEGIFSQSEQFVAGLAVKMIVTHICKFTVLHFFLSRIPQTILWLVYIFMLTLLSCFQTSNLSSFDLFLNNQQSLGASVVIVMLRYKLK